MKSSSAAGECPKPGLPEYAFLGRSNVGKSSLINYLTGRNKLAKISGAPGKTRLINHFIVNDSWYLVDLPGYGYAKVSKKSRTGFEKLIRDYLLSRINLVSLFLLIDIRHKPQVNDLRFIQWLGESMVPFVLVFTKSDKISEAQGHENIQVFREELLKTWEEVPQIFKTSATRRSGGDDILGYIKETIPSFQLRKQNHEKYR